MTKESLESTQLSIEDLIVQGLLKSYYIVYLLFSLRLLKNFDKRIKDTPPSTNKTKYRWLKYLVITIIFISSISMIVDFFPESISKDYFTPLATTIVIIFMGYLGLKQSDILTAMEIKKVENKYKKSALTSEVSENIYQSLIELLNSDKIFSDSEISLPKLAKKMNVAQHHLSQVINEKFNLNFFGLINKFRIEEAKELLMESNHNKMNVSEIAYHVGFNSISAFNSAFKKFTEVSPSQFKGQILEQN
ncbi:MAG: helix-turn-helix transcriptional regulator [Ignavibacteriae bacterium]|nr:helix-turn-helix transcriptional regulator [Ignavibacteriota bacterium]